MPLARRCASSELELLRRVLSAVDGLLLLVLRQGEEVIGLSARDQPLGGADAANHLRHRCAAIDVPDVQRPPGEAEEGGLLPRHVVARRDRIEYCGRHGAGNVEEETIVLEARHARGRQVAGAAQRRALDGSAAAAPRPPPCAATDRCPARRCNLRRGHPIRRIGPRRRRARRRRRRRVEEVPNPQDGDGADNSGDGIDGAVARIRMGRRPA